MTVRCNRSRSVPMGSAWLRAGSLAGWTQPGKELLVLKGHRDWVQPDSADGDVLTAAPTKRPTGQWPTTVTRAWRPRDSAGFNAGNRIVTTSYDGTARVWDAETGRAITPPLRHDGVVQQAVFSSDGRWVVTASWDQTVRLWSATTGDPITPPTSRRGACVRHGPNLDHGQWVGSSSGIWPGDASVADLVC
jgi:WD40 repeat protein